jgi:hypothetical protein
MVVKTNFHWREPSIKKCVGLAVANLAKERVHADVIAEHVVHRKVQGHPTLGVRA